MTDSVFEDALTRIRSCGVNAGVTDSVILSLAHPKAMLNPTLPVRMDGGAMRYFTGCRCRYNSALGPTKGGIFSAQSFDVESVFEQKQQSRKLQDSYCS